MGVWSRRRRWNKRKLRAETATTMATTTAMTTQTTTSMKQSTMTTLTLPRYLHDDCPIVTRARHARDNWDVGWWVMGDGGGTANGRTAVGCEEGNGVWMGMQGRGWEG